MSRVTLPPLFLILPLLLVGSSWLVHSERPQLPVRHLSFILLCLPTSMGPMCLCLRKVPFCFPAPPPAVQPWIAPASYSMDEAQSIPKVSPSSQSLPSPFSRFYDPVAEVEGHFQFSYPSPRGSQLLPVPQCKNQIICGVSPSPQLHFQILEIHI